MTSNEELIERFKNVSGQSEERSRFYLESANWKLDVALSTFYHNVDDGGTDDNADASAGATSQTSQQQRDSVAQSRQRSGNIATLSDANRNRDGNDNEDEGTSDEDAPGQAFYAGGSQHSGQQILGPSKRNRNNFVSKLFDTARNSGATDVSGRNDDDDGANERSNVFAGRAYRLGSSATDASPAIESRRLPTPKTRRVALKMWSNGFSIDNGPLRSYDDPANRAFLATVMSGRVPEELSAQAVGERLHVNMEDHKDEEYVAPKVKAQPFSGRGHTLGGIVPGISETPSTAAEPITIGDGHVTAVRTVDLEDEARRAISYDETEANTTVQVRFSDANVPRLFATLNPARHTVGHLREFIRIARPTTEGRNFTMNMTYPNRRLDDDSVTITAAGLDKACVMLRFV